MMKKYITRVVTEKVKVKNPSFEFVEGKYIKEVVTEEGNGVKRS